jgi:hypothetical protein
MVSSAILDALFVFVSSKSVPATICLTFQKIT